MDANVNEEDVDNFILRYICDEKWVELGDTLKNRYRNMTRNYLSCPELQKFMPLPDYMRIPKENLKKAQTKAGERTKNPKSVQVVESKAPIRRNPKRKIAKVNYYEEEEPNEDRYVFCDNCEEEYLDFCYKCGMLKSLKDFPVPLGTEDRAKKTAPKGVFEVRSSAIHGFGVFAVRNIRKGIQMGPYQGQMTRVNTANGYCWKLRDGRLIDAADETCSNWMRYVNCARHMEEQNVAAFQYKGQLYYRTCKDVGKGEELLVYYGQSFAKNLGIDVKKYFQPNNEEVDCDYFCCEYCKIGLSTRDYRDRHQRYCKFNPEKAKLCTTGEDFVCQYCKVAVTSREFLKRHEINCRKRPKPVTVLKSPIEENEFQCPRCEKKFTRKYCLNQHQIVHEKDNSKILKCDKCSFTTLYSSSLFTHNRTHEVTEKLKCLKCLLLFNQKINLDNHILKNHPDLYYLISSKIHYCQMCNYKTVNISNLKLHIYYNHDSSNTAKKFKCEKCDYLFLQKWNLKRHLLIHSNRRKPFVCTECNKDFIHKHHLDGHLLAKHKGNENLIKSITSKIHQCNKCDYRTVQKNYLFQHIKNHEKENQ